ncbi:uncharacterized protein N7484_004605 [Penicillium longicatenatum]|uniref:uncharacterized protein n=1 Tax=Penicillium longicatenatum TaxID=1561947 RepID=UPI002547EA37|nr:uncharacterized protein N7484_004605 [Penicillium longicatenatum]KAJ5650882.1 hypothetical protein N7484_004605 [Penicillium longicatenatum]
MSRAPPTFTPDSEFADQKTPRGLNGSCLSITALARFEFEAGKGNEGTKILMIEWEDDDLNRSAAEGSWHVSWTGKTTVIPADDRPSDSLRRFYFLLPPNVTIPPVVTLSYEPRATAETGDTPFVPKSGHDSFQLNPLPAIFPPELGATGRAAGKKGVLHTIWAKKRLRVLDREIEEECLNNVEGVALHMAVQEKEWIETNFGVIIRGGEVVSTSHDPSTSTSLHPTGPATPVSPVSGRKLTDKLKGLKLQTSEKDLAVSGNDSKSPTSRIPDLKDLTTKIGSGPNTAHLLSPQSPDVAVSSFSSFSNVASKQETLIPTPITNPTTTPSTLTNPTGAEGLKTIAHFPPSSLQAAQQTIEQGGFASMDSMESLDSMVPLVRTSSGESEDLFAKALSPRSPDLPRSPFSFR